MTKQAVVRVANSIVFGLFTATVVGLVTGQHVFADTSQGTCQNFILTGSACSAGETEHDTFVGNTCHGGGTYTIGGATYGACCIYNKYSRSCITSLYGRPVGTIEYYDHTAAYASVCNGNGCIAS